MPWEFMVLMTLLLGGVIGYAIGARQRKLRVEEIREKAEQEAYTAWSSLPAFIQDKRMSSDSSCVYPPHLMWSECINMALKIAKL